MSIYFVKGKGWRYHFEVNRKRYAKGFYPTQREAKLAEARRKEAIQKGLPDPEKEDKKEQLIQTTTQTDMEFLDLVNRRLDSVKVYNSERHYKDTVYTSKRWVKAWRGLNCSEITRDMVQKYILKRAKVSNNTANCDLRYLRSMFNFGIRQGWIKDDPTKGIGFLPVEKKIKYVPPKEDVLKVIMAASPEDQDYLYCIKETLGRVGEINRLTWNDVDFGNRLVVLYTRKKKGGNLTPRTIPMTGKLYEILSRRYEKRDKRKPWVFWHTYWSKKEKERIQGPYLDRKTLMQRLCKKAGVKYFRFHALRHFGASVLDSKNVNIGSIQRLLGHENRTTTEIYLHSIGSAEREAMDILDLETNACFEKPHTKPHTTKLRKKLRDQLLR